MSYAPYVKRIKRYGMSYGMSYAPYVKRIISIRIQSFRCPGHAPDVAYTLKYLCIIVTPLPTCVSSAGVCGKTKEINKTPFVL